MNDNHSVNNSGWAHLAWAFGGFLFATWTAREQLEDSKKSRAEFDYPDDAAEAFREISQLLDEWEPDEENETEHDFTRDLAEYLDDNSDWNAEVYPKTREGCPDILIDDLIAIELKVDPNKNERNRCIGQCAHYSREWITWIVTIDLAESKVGSLRKVLSDKGLDHILVFNFA